MPEECRWLFYNIWPCEFNVRDFLGQSRHSSIIFSHEVEQNNSLPISGLLCTINKQRIEFYTYRKSTNNNRFIPKKNLTIASNIK